MITARYRPEKMDVQNQIMSRVVLVPCPFQGHLTPMLQLGSALRSKGFLITVAHTGFDSPNQIEFPDFDFVSLVDGLSDPKASSGNFISVIKGFDGSCKAPLQELLARLMGQEKIACIVYDEFMYFSSEVADRLQLPSFVFPTASATTTLIFHMIPRLVKDGFIPVQDSMLPDLVPDLHPLRFRDLPVSAFAGLDDLLQLLSEARNPRSSSAIVWNTSECLEQSSLARLREEYRIPVFAVGPLHKIVPQPSSSLVEEDSSCISWLEKQANGSVIYVSLGSIVSMGKKELTEMAWGLSNSNQPFLWVVRTESDELQEDLRRTAGERGCIVKWAPQRDVLAHRAVGGFWSHCGWNSTIESVSEGVPMICQPRFGDQRVNARYLCHEWRAGLECENDLDRKEVERAIRTLMAEEEGKDIRQRAMELKENVGISVKEGGSSCNNLNDLVNLILSY